MNRIKRITLLLVCVALAASISACDQLSSFLTGVDTINQNQDRPMQIPDELDIGVVVAMSGAYVDGPDDPDIVKFLNDLNFARDEINRTTPFTLRFIIEDDKSTGDGAIEAYNRLIHEEDVVAILGPYSSTQVKVAFPIAEQNEIVAVSPSSAAQGLSALGDFVFRTNLTVEKLIPLGMRIAHEKLGYRQVAKLTTAEDSYSQSADESFSKILDELGVDVLTTETFALGATDFTGQFSRIRDLKPDALLVSAQPLDMPNILKQAREVGIPIDVPIIVPLLTESRVREAGDAAENAITFTAWVNNAENPESMQFVQKYRTTYNEEPDAFSALTYTSVHLLVNAIVNAGSTESHAIRDALAQTRNVHTVLGAFSFDGVGDAVYNPITLIVRDGVFQAYE